MMMKRYFRQLLIACLAIGLFEACDERTPDLYSAPDGVYFNNRTSTNTLQDNIIVTFVYETDDVETIDVPITVQSIGRQTSFDRPVAIRVYSENAKEGIDYELVTPAVMPAYTSKFDYVVRLKRTEILKLETKTVYLELSSNEWFSTFLEQYATGDGLNPFVEMLTYRIDFSDFYSTAPAGWRAEYVGEFSERKLRLLWKLFDNVVDRADYNVAGAIPFNRWVYIQREVDKYMTTQENILRGFEPGEVDVDALVDPDAEGDERRLLDFSPVVSGN